MSDIIYGLTVREANVIICMARHLTNFDTLEQDEQALINSLRDTFKNIKVYGLSD